jgi:predicted KAP-like P-loop ATPase
MTNVCGHPFSADRPIVQKAEDQLNRRIFSEALADAIKGWKQKDSLVLGLYGKWGSGKTSVKNMVVESLREDNASAPLVVEFNPWQWSSQSQIATAFFREVGLVLGAKPDDEDKKRAKKWQEYATYLEFGEFVSDNIRRLVFFLMAGFTVLLGAVGFSNPDWGKPVSITLAVIAGLITAGLGFFKQTAQILSKISSIRGERRERSLEQTRDELKGLMAGSKPVLVVLDDVDRLTPKELKLVFQLVKSNADFPNMIYLFLFQRDVIEKGLEFGDEKVCIISGRNYLEKIINVGFDLPAIPQNKIDSFIDEKTGEWFGAVSEEEGRRFAGIYFDCLQPFFKDLRSAKRFLATLDFHLGLFRQRGAMDVNVVDLIAMEVIRVFEPDVYSRIPSIKKCLTAISVPDRRDDPEVDASKNAIEETVSLASAGRRDNIKELLANLFPVTKQTAGWFSGPPHIDSEQCLREMRICHADIFDRYFTLQLAENEISEADVQQLLSATSSKEAFLAELRGLKTRGLESALMGQLEARKEMLPLGDATSIVSALMDFADELSDNGQGMFSLSPVSHVRRTIYWFLRQEKNLAERGNIFVEAAKQAKGLLLLVTEAQSNDRKEHKDRDANDPEHYLLDEKSSLLLNDIVLERLRQASRSGELLESSSLEYFLYRWKALSGTDEAEKWVEDIITTDAGVRRILVEFLSRSTSHSLGYRFAKVNWKFDLKGLEKFVSIDLFRPQVDKLDVSKLTDQEQLAVDRFNQMVKRKDAGKAYDTHGHFFDDDD